MDTTEAQTGVNTNINTTSPQTRRAHCDAQDSDAPQCLDTGVGDNKQKKFDQISVVHVAQTQR